MNVIGIDYPCMDYLIDIDRLPATNGEAEIHEQSFQGGGMVPTALAVLGRLGESSAMMGVVGDDVYGRFCIEDLERHGVDASRIRVDRGATTDFTICAAERETGGRSFVVRWGSRRKLTPDDLDAAAIRSARYLYLCGEMDELNTAAAKIAKAAGVKVMIDADHYADTTMARLDLIDVLVASEFFLAHIAEGRNEEQLCDAILQSGTEIAVFTMGARGSMGKRRKEGFFRVPAHRVKVVDTTGAGDVFHGAFLYGLLQGWAAERCASFASAVAAIKCTCIGGRAGIPNLQTANRYLATGEIDRTELDMRTAFYRSGLESLFAGN